jgi:hypothetical protein
VSIKEQVEFAKEELTQDEKLLAGLIKIERFYKRNKMAIIAVTAAILVGGIGYGVMNYLQEQQLMRANAALLALQKNPSDKGAWQTLEKENPSLAELVKLQEATKNGDMKTLEALKASKDDVVSDLATYHLAVFKKSAEALKNYRMRSGALLKEFALLDEAYLLMKEGKMEEGKARLALIGEDSPLKPVATMLAHYGITGKNANKGTE